MGASSTTHKYPRGYITKRARKHGLSPGLVRHRLRRGWSLQKALSVLSHITNRRRLTKLRKLSVEANLPFRMVCERIRRGWTMQRALSTKKGAHLDNNLRTKARTAGLNEHLVAARVFRGWSIDKAFREPVRHRDIVLYKAAATLGMNPASIRHRLKAGWGQEEAFSTPPRKGALTRAISKSGSTISYLTVWARIKRGWPLARALSTPIVTTPTQFTVFGVSLRFSQWSVLVGTPTKTLIDRRCRGWSPEEVVFGKRKR